MCCNFPLRKELKTNQCAGTKSLRLEQDRKKKAPELSLKSSNWISMKSKLNCIVCIFLMIAGLGCALVMTTGVYTTLAAKENGLNLPYSQYTQKNSFGPDETPAAVVAGYGSYNDSQLLTLQLVEMNSGRVLWSKDTTVTYGKVSVWPLVIRLSGNYKLRLLNGEKDFDSYPFTVARHHQPESLSSTADMPKEYGQGIFSISKTTPDAESLFATYDNQFIDSLLSKMQQDEGRNPSEPFAQRFPGLVSVRFRLDSKGHVSEPNILQNTLDAECGDYFVRCLTTGSNFSPWPADLQAQFGKDSRIITLTFRFD